MLQVDKSLTNVYLDGEDFKDSLESSIDQPNQLDDKHEGEDDFEKNPIINKRILLEDKNADIHNLTKERILNFDKNDIIKKLERFDDAANEVDTDLNTVDTGVGGSAVDAAAVLNEEDEEGHVKNIPQDVKFQKKSEGRIAIFGDSNCLDSTHLDKPCYWLLDALLEYTMTNHISNLLKDLNKLSKLMPGGSSFVDGKRKQLPTRLAGTNLHQFSKVLHPSLVNQKRSIPKCMRLLWEPPIFLNLTATDDLKLQSDHFKQDHRVHEGEESSIRRKLESQKGEVRSG